MHHACADPVPAAVLLQEVLLAIAEKHRKQAKRPQLVGLHGRVPNPQLVALMKDCWHPVRSCCLWQLSMFCQSHHTFAFHIQTLCKTAYVLVAHKKLAYALFRGHFPELESVFYHGHFAAFWPAMCIIGLSANLLDAAGCCTEARLPHHPAKTGALCFRDLPVLCR